MLVGEAARLRGELKKVCTEAFDFDVSPESLEILETKVATMRDQIASLLTIAGSVRRREELVCTERCLKIIDVDLNGEPL